MGSYETFFVATDDELDALFPGWIAPRANRAREQTDSDGGIAEDVEPDEDEPEPLGSPSFRDDVWGPRRPPIRPCENGYHEMMEQECPPGLAALPHYRTKNLWSLFDADRVAHLLLDTDEPGQTPPLRVGVEGDDDVPVVFGWAPEDAHALASCEDERLDALVYELIADEDESEDDDVEVDGEVWVSVRQSLRAVRALARKAGKAGAHLCLYFAMHY